VAALELLEAVENLLSGELVLESSPLSDILGEAISLRGRSSSESSEDSVAAVPLETTVSDVLALLTEFVAEGLRLGPKVEF